MPPSTSDTAVSQRTFIRQAARKAWPPLFVRILKQNAFIIVASEFGEGVRILHAIVSTKVLELIARKKVKTALTLLPGGKSFLQNAIDTDKRQRPINVVDDGPRLWLTGMFLSAGRGLVQVYVHQKDASSR